MKSRKEEGLSYKRCKTVRREPAQDFSQKPAFSPISCKLEEDRSRRPAQTQHKPALLPSPALGPTTPNPAQTRSSLCPLSSVTCGLWSRAVSISEHSLSRCNISLLSGTLILFAI
ncbi:hypothetical protein MRB53_020727 [Persea americana]|uniref:Uncharacterized protein n=1 Tax=Persea americana TaxID=3435 RepID=A0ACC2L1X8_PERAE|nr:hypothetical protein MRB53_020727 [Persea americana]